MATALPIVVLVSGTLLLAEAVRRRAKVPSYVHGVALGVAAVSAVVLWRGGGLYGGGLARGLTLLVPPAAIYFFFLSQAGSPAPQDGDPKANAGGGRDRDV